MLVVYLFFYLKNTDVLIIYSVMTLICFEYTHFGFSKIIKVRWCYSHFINKCLNYYLILASRKSHFNNIPFKKSLPKKKKNPSPSIYLFSSIGSNFALYNIYIHTYIHTYIYIYIYIYILSNIFEGSNLSNKDCYLQL